MFSERKKPSFNVRDRLEWERKIAELTLEGSDAFERLYRME